MPRLHPFVPFFLLLSCLVFGGPLWGQVTIGEKNIRERDPVLRADGMELFFTRVAYGSNLGAQNADDIWTRSRTPDGSWGRSLNPGSPINSFAHDRALALSPDGTRLAVLRQGIEDYVDLLELTGRNWRILESWPLPAGVAPYYDATFDPNALQLIYSTIGPDGSRDLFKREAYPDGQWSEAIALSRLNGRDNETRPQLATDGRALYFRRNDDQWLRRNDPDGVAIVVDIPAQVQQFTVAADTYAAALPAVVMQDDLGQEERLLTRSLPAGSLPPATRLVRAYLPSPPPPGAQTTRVALNNQLNLKVYPDAMQRYAVFLRQGEELLVDGRIPEAVTTGESNGSLAASGTAVAAPTSEKKRLQAGIAQRQRELERLDAERRKYELALPREDLELDRLRDQYYRSSRPAGDTLPPRTTAKGAEASRERYAAELAELERMKAKFRRQQDEKLQQKDRSGYRWSESDPVSRSSNATAPTPASTTVPSIGEAYTPPVYLSPADSRRRAYEDSVRINSTVKTGLYGDVEPRAYEREPWENELKRDLPRTTPLTAEEAARLDADYQRKLDELAALKAEWSRVNGGAKQPQQTATAAPAARHEPYRLPANGTNQQQGSWTTKGQPAPVDPYQRTATQPQAPATYGQPATTPQPTYQQSRSDYRQPTTDNRQPATTYGNPPAKTAPPAYQQPAAYGAPATTAPGVPAGITFIPNTAYPDGAGYGGLDQLVRQIQTATSVVEIRIHTPTNLDRRVAQLLSEERAVTIRNFLLEQGVNAKHFRVLGFGNNLTGQGGERVEVRR